MKANPLLVWLLSLTLLCNTGLNLFLLYSLSRIYTINEDFRPDVLLYYVRNKIEADNIKLPPMRIVKFLSADIYAKDYMIFTGQEILIFINLSVDIDLSNSELKALLAHEIGHYVLGHLSGQPRLFSGIEEGNLNQEIGADAFAAKYEGKKTVAAVIKKLIWDAGERDARLNAISDR